MNGAPHVTHGDTRPVLPSGNAAPRARGDGPNHAERADRSADGALTIEGEIWTNDDIVDYE